MKFQKFVRELTAKQNRYSKLIHYLARLNTTRINLLLRQVESEFEAVQHIFSGDLAENENIRIEIEGPSNHNLQELTDLEHKMWKASHESCKLDKECKRGLSQFWHKLDSNLKCWKARRRTKAYGKYLTAKLLKKWKLIKERDRFLHAEGVLLNQLAKSENKMYLTRKVEVLQLIAERMPQHREEIQHMIANISNNYVLW